MKKDHYPSIFNDVLAPVTQGPSSANTAGPYRIGTIARAILKGKPVKLKIKMSLSGGFFATFYNMQSDKGFLAGILGMDILNDDIGNVYEAAKASGLEYEFKFTEDVPAFPTELAVVTVTSHEETINMRAVSRGGGEILINEIEGKTCVVTGMHEEEITVHGEARKVPCVYPMHTEKDAVPLFTTSKGMLDYAKNTGKELWEAAVDYEMSLTGLSYSEIMETADKTLDIVYRAIDRGLEPGVRFEGITVAMAPEIKEKMKTEELIPMGASSEGSLQALALMEYSNSHGTIVCMPTGGAVGIIPASIRSAASSMGKTREDEVKALLTAGLIGVFYYATRYHGSLGCQAEVGIAASMASSALASFISKDPEALERAAVLAMQYLLGQVCDPIEGYVQIPCIIRNVASVSLAAACANYGVLGLDTAVSLDEIAEACLRTGEAIRNNRVSDLGTCACEYCVNPHSTLGMTNKETTHTKAGQNYGE